MTSDVLATRDYPQEGERRYLYGHSSPESALVELDYPYGFRLRTTIRYWLETTRQGDRFVSQTRNPKTGLWNKPKKSTYTGVGVLYLDPQNHVQWTGVMENVPADRLAAFTATHKEHLNEQQRRRLARIIGYTRAMEHVTFHIRANPGTTVEEARHLDAEQAKSYQSLGHLMVRETIKATHELGF